MTKLGKKHNIDYDSPPPFTNKFMRAKNNSFLSSDILGQQQVDEPVIKLRDNNSMHKAQQQELPKTYGKTVASGTDEEGKIASQQQSVKPVPYRATGGWKSQNFNRTSVAGGKTTAGRHSNKHGASATRISSKLTKWSREPTISNCTSMGKPETIKTVEKPALECITSARSKRPT